MILNILIIFFYQSYAYQTIETLIVFSIKQAAGWVLACYYFFEFPSEYFEAASFVTVCIVFFYFMCQYFNYLKDIKICKLKLKTQESNQKIFSIVSAIPDCFTIIDENIKSLFSNRIFKDLMKEKSFFEFLSESSYHKRICRYDNSTAIVSDIKDSFATNLGTEINYGIIKNHDDMIE